MGGNDRCCASLPLDDRGDGTPALSSNSARTALSKMSRSVWRRCGMEGASRLILRRKPRLGLLTLGAIVVLTGGAAQAQNIDQGKSATRLFADSCATCHQDRKSTRLNSSHTV